MKKTYRSLFIAIMACLSMALYAESVIFSPSVWIAWTFFGATLALSSYGCWMGWLGARERRTLWAWLALLLNAFLFVSLLAFTYLLLR